MYYMIDQLISSIIHSGIYLLTGAVSVTANEQYARPGVTGDLVVSLVRRRS